MIRLKLLFCARGVMVDEQSNTASVYSIIEEITPESLPLLIPTVMVLVLLERDEEDEPQQQWSLRVTLNDQVVLDHQAEVDFEDKTRHRTIVTLGGLPVLQAGILRFGCFLGDKMLGEYVVNVSGPRQRGPEVEVRA